MSEVRLTAPLTRADARALALGDTVFLDGEIVATAGYPTHQRIVAAIRDSAPLPVDLSGATFFHMGHMSREDGGRLTPLYVNPTTSTRFDAFMPAIIRRFGLTATAGKGGLGPASVEAMRETGCVYFSMIGGAAPVLTEGVREVLATGFDDLIMQFRLTRFRVEGFGPLTVAIDAHGNSTYERLSASARERVADIMAGLGPRRETG